MFTIIIVNFNGMKYLPRCLEAVRKQDYAAGKEIIVVNNRSTDGSLEYLRQQPDVRVIDPGCNTGFSRGNNLAILASNSPYVLCLNFDCFLTPDFLSTVAATFERHPEAGSIAPKLLKFIDSAPSEILDSSGVFFDRCVPDDRGEWRRDIPRFNQAGYVFGPSGAAASFRRAALEAIRFGNEFFDEDLFIYCEDIDIAWRMNMVGWKTWYEPKALGYHVRGSTRREDAWERRNLFVTGYRNRLLIMFKNLRWRQDILPNLWGILLWEARFNGGWCRGGLGNCAIMLQSVARFFAKLLTCPRYWRKRWASQAGRTDNSYSMGFSQPSSFRRIGPAQFYYPGPAPLALGKVAFAPPRIIPRNLRRGWRRRDPAALAAGVSRRGDPQFRVSLPPNAQDCKSKVLRVDLYSSFDTEGEVIWEGSAGDCVSERFDILTGRHTYYLDLGQLATLHGNDSARRGPVSIVRLGPSVRSGVRFAVYSMVFYDKAACSEEAIGSQQGNSQRSARD